MEVMEDPRDAVVRKHGQMANAVQEEWMWIVVGGQKGGWVYQLTAVNIVDHDRRR